MRFIRENEALVRQALEARRDDAPLDELLELDACRRELLVRIESLRGRRNDLSKQIGNTRVAEERQALIEQARDLSTQLERSEPDLAEIDRQIHDRLLLMPALPHPSVPRGAGEEDSPVLRTTGEAPTFDFDPRPHWDLGGRLGILDFPRAANVAGSGFWLFKGVGARLQRALVSWMVEFHAREHGYREIYPPSLVTTQGMVDAGKLPKFAVDSYTTTTDPLWLSPTAEVALAVMHRGETLDGAALPVKYVAYSPSFRREAGAAGTETRGLRRVHQFDKVELFIYTDHESSYADLETMLASAEATVAGLELPYYRVREICTGDLGFAASKQYDIEVWAPGAQDWLEVSSVSNCEAFQARRAGVRVRRPGESRSELAHTLNGSGIALPRTVIALLENFQEADGTVRIPSVLRPYLGGAERLEPEAPWP